MSFGSGTLVNGSNPAQLSGSFGINPGDVIAIALRGSSDNVSYEFSDAVRMLPPQVTSVALVGSNTNDAQNGVYDFAINDPTTNVPRVGSGEQLRSVPLGGIQEIKIKFSKDVDVVGDDLSVIGLHNPLLNQPYLVFVNYNSTNFTATWEVDFRKDKMGVPRADAAYFDHYLLRLKDTITEAGNGVLALDGEWVNPANLGANDPLFNEFPSGDDSPGGDFQFVFTVLPGDFEPDNDVDIIDFGLFADFFGDSGTNYLSGDYDGDGDTDLIDFGIIADAFGETLIDLAFAADSNGDYVIDMVDRAAYDASPYDINGDGLTDSIDDAMFGLLETFGVEILWA